MWRIRSSNGWWSVFGKKRSRGGKKVGPPAHEDLVLRRFRADAPTRLWLWDITEHPTAEGRIYLCAVKDVFSNRIVGYSISDRMTSQMAVNALVSAVQHRRDAAGGVVHSDRGSQFRSRKVARVLAAHDLVGSMGQGASAGDNAAMESLVSTARDVTAARRTEHDLRFRATHDPLTGLANRHLLAERLDRAMARLDERGGVIGVVLVDLDGFKTVNDVHGHDVGDAMLVEAAGRLRRAAGPSATVARLGGDEFVILCETSEVSHATALADRAEDALSAPYSMAPGIRVSASAGWATTPRHLGTGQLLARADQAMYQRKRDRRGEEGPAALP